MRIVFLIAAFAALAPAQKPALAENELPADTLIVLRRGACEQRCAVYNLTIHADGSVIFDGRHFVRRPGLYKGQAPTPAVAAILHQARDIGFFSAKPDIGYNDTSSCKSLDDGRPRAILTISSGGESHTIIHSHRCVSDFSKQLRALEDAIDKAASSSRWIK